MKWLAVFAPAMWPQDTGLGFMPCSIARAFKLRHPPQRRPPRLGDDDGVEQETSQALRSRMYTAAESPDASNPCLSHDRASPRTEDRVARHDCRSAICRPKRHRLMLQLRTALIDPKGRSNTN